MAKHRLLGKNAENDHIIKAGDDLNTFSVGPGTEWSSYYPLQGLSSMMSILTSVCLN